MPDRIPSYIETLPNDAEQRNLPTPSAPDEIDLNIAISSVDNIEREIRDLNNQLAANPHGEVERQLKTERGKKRKVYSDCKQQVIRLTPHVIQFERDQIAKLGRARDEVGRTDREMGFYRNAIIQKQRSITRLEHELGRIQGQHIH